MQQSASELRKAAEAAKRQKDLNTARAVVALADSEGWKHFEGLARQLIESNTPNVSQFSNDGATLIASQIAFISGIKRCLGLIDQQKDILSSLTAHQGE